MFSVSRASANRKYYAGGPVPQPVPCSGTSLVMVEPAPMVAPAATVTLEQPAHYWSLQIHHRPTRSGIYSHHHSSGGNGTCTHVYIDSQRSITRVNQKMVEFYCPRQQWSFWSQQNYPLWCWPPGAYLGAGAQRAPPGHWAQHWPVQSHCGRDILRAISNIGVSDDTTWANRHMAT